MQPTRAAYIYVNMAGALITAAALSLFAMGRDGTATSLIPVMITFSGLAYLLLVHLGYAAVVRKASVDPRLSDILSASLAPFSHGVTFAAAPVDDARAFFWRRGYCVMPDRLATDLATEGGDERRKRLGIFTVAHELGHLLSHDTQAFALCFALFVYGIVSACGLWAGLLLGALTFRPAAVLGLAYVTAMFLYMMYESMRMREFFADQIAAAILGHGPVKTVVERRAREEKHLVYPRSYLVTHPKFCDRATRLNDFSKTYEYGYVRALFTSFVLALNIALIPFAATGLGSLLGILGQVLGAILALWFNSFIVFSLVVPATLVDRLGLRDALLRAIVVIIGTAFNIAFLGWSLLGRDILGHLARQSEGASRMVGGVLGLLCLHAAYWFAARYTLRFRGPKRPDRAFYRRMFILAAGGATATAGMLVTLGRWIVAIALGNSMSPDDDVVTTLTVALIFGAITLLCASAWVRYVRRRSAAWGATTDTTARFVEMEWCADHVIQQSVKPGKIKMVGIFALAFVAGLVLTPIIASHMGTDPITATLAWIVASPAMWWSARRNAKRTSLPPTYMLAPI